MNAMSKEADIVESVAEAIYNATPRNKPWISLSAWKKEAFMAGSRAALDTIGYTSISFERGAAARDMRERCAKVADGFTGYSGYGTEGDNDLLGMFARGNRNAERQITNLIRDLPDTPGDQQP